MPELPLEPFKRIIRNQGADRVSERAASELRDDVESYAERRAEESTKYANHADRKTVQVEDIKASK